MVVDGDGVILSDRVGWMSGKGSVGVVGWLGGYVKGFAGWCEGCGAQDESQGLGWRGGGLPAL